MLSCVRKMEEYALIGKLTRNLTIHGRQLGFQKGLSPEMKLLDVDATVKCGLNRVAYRDLAKAYDKVKE